MVGFKLLEIKKVYKIEGTIWNEINTDLTGRGKKRKLKMKQYRHFKIQHKGKICSENIGTEHWIMGRVIVQWHGACLACGRTN